MQSKEIRGAFQSSPNKAAKQLCDKADDRFESVGYVRQVKTRPDVATPTSGAGETLKPRVRWVEMQTGIRGTHDEQRTQSMWEGNRRKQPFRSVPDLKELTNTFHESLQKPANLSERALPFTLPLPEGLQNVDVSHVVNSTGKFSGRFNAGGHSPPTGKPDISTYTNDVGSRLAQCSRVQSPLQVRSTFTGRTSSTKEDLHPGGAPRPLWTGASSPPSLSECGVKDPAVKNICPQWDQSPYVEDVVEGELEQLLYSVRRDDAHGSCSRPERQRWVLFNKSQASTFTVEYIFEDSAVVAGVVIAPNGRCVVTVPPGERRVVAEGPRTQFLRLVRLTKRSFSKEAKEKDAIEKQEEVGERSKQEKRKEKEVKEKEEEAIARRLQGTVAATDRLTLALIEELRGLSAALREGRPRALAALCRRHGVDYVDQAFPPLSTSLGWANQGQRNHRVRESNGDDAKEGNDAFLAVRWVSAKRAMPSLGLAVALSGLAVGPLGDRGVAAALAVLAAPAWSLHRTFASTTNEDAANGVYAVWLARRGVWGLVLVDGYLPRVQDGRTGRLRPYGCASVPGDALWVGICEKALAKASGSYAALVALPAACAIGCFTGGPVEVWDWWKKDCERAFLEMDAVIKTSERGFGIVLLTTVDVTLSTSLESQLGRSEAREHGLDRTPVVLSNMHDASIGASSSDLNSVREFFQRTGLEPGITYQVLSVTENARGGLMVLVRDWQKRSQESLLFTGQVPCLSPRNGRSGSEDARQSEVAIMAELDNSCVWLKYEDEVLKFFQHCHVCFDCRCYHDARVVVPFKGNPIAVPSFFFRVRILPVPHGTPARLWIGLHQPLDENLGKCGLKLVLIVEDDTWRELDTTSQGMESTPCAHPSYAILAESYGGIYQSLPVVWMYVELGVHETLPLVFYILPQIRLINRGPLNNSYVAGAEAGVDQSFNSLDATVALLAENRDIFELELLHAPDGLGTELYRGPLNRLNWSSCKPVSPSWSRKPKSASDAEGSSKIAEVGISSITECPSNLKVSYCQLNGRWMNGFSW